MCFHYSIRMFIMHFIFKNYHLIQRINISLLSKITGKAFRARKVEWMKGSPLGLVHYRRSRACACSKTCPDRCGIVNTEADCVPETGEI